MEQNQERDAQILPGVAAQMREIMATMYMASCQLIPAEAREQDPVLDQKAAVLDQSYFRLLRIVNNLSACEYFSSDTPLTLSDIAVPELLERLCRECSTPAQTMGISVSFVCREAPPLCAAHADALELIFYHLMSNAIKFTPRGGSVTVDLRPDAQRTHLLLTVADTGCGITPEQMEHLFDRYLHTDPAPRPHGIGLGLPLSRQIAQRMGGTLVAQSEVGRGSRFTLSLPLRTLGNRLSDVRLPYSGGFNTTLLGLADALSPEAFSIRMQK